MIEKIKGLPINMVGFRTDGEVVKDDFKFVTKEVSSLVDKTDQLNYLLFLDNSPKDFTLGAWIQDAILGIKKLTKWNRAAIVTDSESVINFTNIFSQLMPGEFKGFRKADYELAVAWTSEKKEIV